MTDPQNGNSQAQKLPTGAHEVILAMDPDLPETIQAELDPVIIQLAIPVAWFSKSVRSD